MVMHPSEANEQLSAARMACLACGHMLAPWGFAHRRSVRGHYGTTQLRPRRARCRGCRTTHVMLPASCLPRRAVTVKIVGQALLAPVNGASHRTIAADLELPADTVRGWIRRATAHASWLREWAPSWPTGSTPNTPSIRPTGTPLGDALEALGNAAAAATRQLGLLAPPWELIAYFTGGRLLTPVSRAG